MAKQNRESIAWCPQCGDELEWCYAQGSQAQFVATMHDYPDREMWDMYYCFGCDALFKMRLFRDLTTITDEDKNNG